MIEDARARGVDVLGDVYPYNAGSTKLDNLMAGVGPRWRHHEAARAPGRPRHAPPHRGGVPQIDGERWGTVSQGGIGFDQIFIASCKRASSRA